MSVNGRPTAATESRRRPGWLRPARADLGAFGHGQFAVDYEERADQYALREARVERVQQLLRESDLDALLVYKDENVRYLTGMRAQLIAGKSALLNGCLLLPEGAPIMLISGGDLQRSQAAMPWIREFHPIPILEAPGPDQRHGRADAQAAARALRARLRPDRHRRVLLHPDPDAGAHDARAAAR